MATAITSKNLTYFKESLDQLKTETTRWENYINTLEGHLNDNIGQQFADGYEVGAKWVGNMKTIIRLLRSAKSDLNTLIQKSEDFVQKQTAASK